MAEYSYDDVVTLKDILTGAVDKESLIGKMVYCSDSITTIVKYASNDDMKGKLLEVSIDEGMIRPFLTGAEGGNKARWHYIIPEKEKSYEERQAEWVKENNLKAGDKVRILKQFNIGERGVPFRFNNAMLSLIGEVCEVFEITDNRIRVYDKHRVTYWVWPYFCLEKVEPEYVPFDLSKEEDRNFLRGKWVKSNDPYYFYEYQITKFDRLGDGTYVVSFDSDGHRTGTTLLEDFVFLDGTPVGKLVMEGGSND